MTDEAAPVAVAAVPTGALHAISGAIIEVYRDRFGRPPDGVKTYAEDDLVVCVLRGGLVPIERTLAADGRQDLVRRVRAAFTESIAPGIGDAIEAATGRKVMASLSQAHVDPDIAIEVFLLDAPAS
jgi:uncharacterized protein YbcI